MRAGTLRDQQMRVAVAGQQRGLEEEHRHRPHRRRAAEHRQHHLGEHRLDGEQQQRRQERRRRVGPQHEPRPRRRRCRRGGCAGPAGSLAARARARPCRSPSRLISGIPRNSCLAGRPPDRVAPPAHTVTVWPTFGTTTLWPFISATNLSASGSSMPGKVP